MPNKDLIPGLLIPLYWVLPCRTLFWGVLGKKVKGRYGQMFQSIPGQLASTCQEAFHLSALPSVQETTTGRWGLTCCGGDAQEPAGVFQPSPEHL